MDENGKTLALFGTFIVVLALEVFIIYQKHRGWDSGATRVVGLTVIGFLGLIGIFMVPDQAGTRMTIFFSLLGTLAGGFVGATFSRGPEAEPASGQTRGPPTGSLGAAPSRETPSTTVAETSKTPTPAAEGT